MSYAYTIAGGFPPYTCGLISGALPPGLTLNTAGVINGVPTTAGAYSWSVGVTDNFGQTAHVDDSANILTATAVTISGDAPNGNVGTAYSYAYTAGAGVPPYTFSVFSGTIPTGLTLSAAGVLSGTPSAPGAFSWRVRVTDKLGQTAFVNDTNSVTQTVGITGDAPDCEIGVAYNFAYTVVGTATPVTVTLKTGALPTGLSVSSAGVITGTPTTVGDYTWTLEAKDANNVTATVNDAAHTYAKVTIAGDAPAGVNGTPYSFTYTASLGKTPYVFALASGTLPNGLTISSAGVLSGTPTASGTYTWSTKVTDSLGGVATIADSSVISDPALPDPYFANVVALLHFDNDITDVKGKTWVPSGTLPFNIATPMYGSGNVGKLTPSQYLVSPTSTDFNFGTGDFTVEFSFRMSAGSTPAGPYMFDMGTGNLTVVQFNPQGKLAYYDPVTSNGSGPLYNGPASSTIGDGNRHTIAISRVSGVIYAFLDGVMWGQQASTHNKTHTTACLNKYGGGTSNGNNNIEYDELRITKGVGRYTANYTPSAVPFPNVGP